MSWFLPSAILWTTKVVATTCHRMFIVYYALVYILLNISLYIKKEISLFIDDKTGGPKLVKQLSQSHTPSEHAAWCWLGSPVPSACGMRGTSLSLLPPWEPRKPVMVCFCSAQSCYLVKFDNYSFRVWIFFLP